MSNYITPASLVVAGLVLWRLYSRGQTRSVHFAVAAFFVLFAYGPAVNLLVGSGVYDGIVLARVDVAVVGFALALVGIALGDFLVPQRDTFDITRVVAGTRRYELLFFVYVGLIGYGAAICLTRGPSLLGVDKLTALATAGPGHGIYLLAEICAVSTYFLSRRSGLYRSLWVVNLGIYTIYCLLTSERDFLLVVFAVLIHREMLGNGARALRVAGVAAGAVLTASFLFAFRADASLDVTGVLNQGSILFVDTIVIDQVSSGGTALRYGGSYADALVGLPPTWLVDAGSRPLSSWLVEIYAPGSGGGYGFSLTGEAYLNFGLVGIPVFFLVVTVAHRFVVNRADRSDWWAFFSVYSTSVLMYCLRADTYLMLKNLAYGAVFFAGIWILSSKRSSSALARTDVPDHGLVEDRPVESVFAVAPGRTPRRPSETVETPPGATPRPLPTVPSLPPGSRSPRLRPPRRRPASFGPGAGR